MIDSRVRESNFVSLFGIHGKWVAMAVMTLLTLIFAEVIPKTLSVAHNELFATIVCIPLNLFERFITPLIWLFNKAGGPLLKKLSPEKKKIDSEAIMEDEFLDMVDQSHKSGELKSVERDLIHNVFEFSDTRANEVMTPSEKIFSLPVDMDASSIIKSIKKNPYSRIPVYRGNRGNIVGILYVKDMLKFDSKRLAGKAKILSRICRKPFFISEDKNIDDLFQNLRLKRIHIALALDKSGNVSGLVTMEDLLEELFGELYDEHDMDGA